MKLEFHPDFKFRIVFKAIWPNLKGAFDGLRFRPSSMRTRGGKTVAALSLAAILLLAALLAWLLSR